MSLRESPSAEDFARTARGRAYKFALCALALALAASGAFMVTQSLLLPIVLLVILLALVTLWRYPGIMLPIVFTAVCLFELLPTHYADAFTDQIPFFWNINTIIQRYAFVLTDQSMFFWNQRYSLTNFKAVPLNLLEVLLLFSGTSAFLHAAYTKKVKLQVGPLFWPIFVYICFVGMGWANGTLTGGDFKISLMEVRPQFYFLLAYLMAFNILRERRQINTLFWTMALCIGLKGCLYTFRRYVTLGGLPLPDQGVGSHEEAFLFDTFVVLLIVLSLFQEHKRLRRVMWCLLPLVFMGNLATNRRAGTAALVIVVPILFLAADRALPNARVRIRIIGCILLVLFSGYYQAFKNSDNAFAQPARALKSQFAPDARDLSSNLYRDAENMDLMATIKLSPVQGYGYGKHMLHAVEIADISKDYEYWDIMPHNQILWVWMRVGTLGFAAFWMMVSALIIRACQTLRREHADSYIKAVATFSLLVTSMLMIFGLLDLQLVNFRDMLFTGFWAGAMAAVPRMAADPPAEKEVTP